VQIQTYIKIQIQRHNNAVWELHKFFFNTRTSRCFTLVNIRAKNNKAQDNTVPSWLLLYICPTKPCKCNIRLKSNILLVLNHPHDKPPLVKPITNVTIQFVECTYCNDKFPPKKIIEIKTKYVALIEDIKQQ
jgi:hypothetical protein